MAITSTAPPLGQVFTTYADGGYLLSASGGIPPYHWKWDAKQGSSLPPGLHIADNGLLSGTPKIAGDYLVIVTASDSGFPISQVSQQYPIDISGQRALTITSDTPPDGVVGTEYGPSTTQYQSCRWSPVLGWHEVCTPCSTQAACSALPPCRGQMSPLPCSSIKVVFLGFTFTASGGIPPYIWKASDLPDHLSLDPNTGQMTGVPAIAGIYSFTVTVTDVQFPPAQSSGSYTVDITNP
jgi:hypothetical protein